ncbi:conserved hypothetical protein [Thiocapsa sp. KS1]|jgi:hypothetical protein|nr:hypothetical protein [Thiocapsa sp. KS1]CRI66276.1 conserved hypothetical protein [Thiocapsa sp. KS1]
MTSTATAVCEALTALGLPNLAVVADPGAVAALEQTPGCRIGFAAALRLALEAFLGDGRGSPGQGHDSALDLVRAAPDAYGLDPAPTDAAISEVLRRTLAEDPEARIVLLSAATVQEPSYRFLPEYGEDIATHWVFRIVAPNGWPSLQWAIVDPRGETAAYSYGFE